MNVCYCGNTETIKALISMPITQYDIAREAGVSQTIVSDVLQARPRGRVSEETRQRIFETARRLGYRPNAAARALRTGLSRRILYLLVSTETGQPSAQSDAGISGLATALTSQDYKLLVLPESSHDRALRELQQMLAASECDGCILRVVREDHWNWSAILEVKRPILILGRITTPCLPSVCYDSIGSMRLAVQRLVERGHRRIGFLSARVNMDNTDYIACLWQSISSEYGIDPTKWFDYAGERAEADVIAAQWLSEEKGPTAFVCVHKRAAVGVTNAIVRNGLTLADTHDLVVLGDIVLGDSISPWLYEPGTWYFDNDQEHIGTLAAQKMIRMIEEKVSTGSVHITPKLCQVSAHP